MVSSLRSKASKRTNTAEHGKAGSAPAIDRGFDILELLATSPEGLTLSEISDVLSVPKNSVFRITQTLQARGYLERESHSLVFRLTSKILNLAPHNWVGPSLTDVARGPMKQLRDEVRETVQLGVLSELEGVIIDQVESDQPLRITVNLGLRFKLHNNAPGKLLLAFLAAERQQEVLDQIELDATTKRTITKKPLLKTECARIVKQGYSTDYAEADDGIHCIAAPIFGIDREVVGAIWVSGPAKRLPKSRFQELGTKTIATGNRITYLIGDSV